MNDDQIIITKTVEFDAGHRVPYHASKCRNAHGHRYKLQVTVSGIVLPMRGESDDGMIMDFGFLKQVMNDYVVEPWDHAFLVYDGDIPMLEALELLGNDHKTVRLDFIPTAENLVSKVSKILYNPIKEHGVVLHSVTLYETPNSVAVWKAQ
jgi:6-pyruvoyltetrahydropterin/6-carboxytetrahydropterin synthase